MIGGAMEVCPRDSPTSNKRNNMKLILMQMQYLHLVIDQSEENTGFVC